MMNYPRHFSPLTHPEIGNYTLEKATPPENCIDTPKTANSPPKTAIPPRKAPHYLQHQNHLPKQLVSRNLAQLFN
jgi:hypothetical protein